MLNIEKKYIDSFHPDNRVAGKLVVLRRRLKVLHEAGRMIKLHTQIWDMINKYLSKRHATKGYTIFHYDKGGENPVRCNHSHLTVFNKAFKDSTDRINRFKLTYKLLDIYNISNEPKKDKTLADVIPALKELQDTIDKMKENAKKI